MARGRLRPKQQRFVEEYLVDLNATQAAIRAGYSPKTAAALGYENLRKPEIAAAIEEGRKQLSQNTGITTERVLQEYARIAFADIRNLMSWSNAGVTLVDSATLTDDQAAAVAEVFERPTKDGGIAMGLKTHDKKGALDSIAKHLGMFVDRQEVTGKDGGPIEHKHVTEGQLKEYADLIRTLAHRPPDSASVSEGHRQPLDTAPAN